MEFVNPLSDATSEGKLCPWEGPDEQRCLLYESHRPMHFWPYHLPNRPIPSTISKEAALKSRNAEDTLLATPGMKPDLLVEDPLDKG